MAAKKHLPKTHDKPERLDYIPTPAEVRQLRAHVERVRDRAPVPRLKAPAILGAESSPTPDHPDTVTWSVALQSAFGTIDHDVAMGLTNGLLNAMRRDGVFDESTANAALAMVTAIAPRDEIEAMLVSQMIATHAAAMDLIGRARRAEWRHQLVDNGNLSTKLLRTYTAQLEALQRYRGKGQQKVTVEHVHVHQGGQAIVGNVEATRGVGSPPETEERPHAKQLAHAPEPTLPCPDPERQAVPVARGEG